MRVPITIPRVWYTALVNIAARDNLSLPSYLESRLCRILREYADGMSSPPPAPAPLSEKVYIPMDDQVHTALQVIQKEKGYDALADLLRAIIEEECSPFADVAHKNNFANTQELRQAIERGDLGVIPLFPDDPLQELQNLVTERREAEGIPYGQDAPGLTGLLERFLQAVAQLEPEAEPEPDPYANRESIIYANPSLTEWKVRLIKPPFRESPSSFGEAACPLGFPLEGVFTPLPVSRRKGASAVHFALRLANTVLVETTFYPEGCAKTHTFVLGTVTMDGGAKTGPRHVQVVGPVVKRPKERQGEHREETQRKPPQRNAKRWLLSCLLQPHDAALGAKMVTLDIAEAIYSDCRGNEL